MLRLITSILIIAAAFSPAMAQQPAAAALSEPPPMPAPALPGVPAKAAPSVSPGAPAKPAAAVPLTVQVDQGRRKIAELDAKIAKLANEIGAGADTVKSHAETGGKYQTFANNLVAWEGECMTLGIQLERRLKEGQPEVYQKRLREEHKECEKRSRDDRKVLTAYDLEMEKLKLKVNDLEAAVDDANKIKNVAERNRQSEKLKLELEASVKSTSESIKKFEAMPR